jgi:hypothetical protein
MHAGTNDVAMIVSGEPTTAAVDPNVYRLDRNRFDNFLRIETAR